MRLITLNSYKDWLEWRQGGIGASDAPSVMDSSPFMTKKELWARKTERLIQPKKQTPQMRRGKDLEPIARKAYEKMTGILMPPAYLESDLHPYALASADGINLVRGLVLEIKCAGKTDHALALKKQIPNKYLWQLVHLLMVSGLDRCDYFSFDGTNGVIVEFHLNKVLQSQLESAEKEFWDCVLNDKEPAPKPSNVITGTFQERLRKLQAAKNPASIFHKSSIFKTKEFKDE